MLTLKRVRPEQAAPYYTQDEERSQTEVQQKSFWYGDGAVRLGLNNSVNKQVFKQLLKGYLPDGSRFKKRLPTRSDYKSIGAIDLCFSLPKEASLLIGIKGNRDLINAATLAVKETLDKVETEAARTRIRTARGRETIYTDNLVIANFLHATSRANDPQYHIHSLVLNLTQIQNGQWYCLHNNAFFKHKQLFNSYFFNALARLWRKLGYEIEARSGYITLAGFKSEQIEHFSTRRKQILRLVPVTATRTKRQIANLKTRVAKSFIPLVQLRRQWKDRARNIGLIFPTPIMSSSKTINAVSAADAVTEAIAHYSRSQIAISRREIEAYILEERLGLFKQSEIDAAISQKLGDEIVLADGRFITNAAIDREKETIALAAKDRDRIAPLAWDAVQYCQKLLDEGITLTKGQENALLSSVTSTDRVVIWQGIAGSGKSFALKHLTEIAAEQGIAITGIAPTNSAAQNLATAVGIECLTVANFLNPKNIDRDRSSLKQFFERGEDGVRRLEVDRGLIVDESGLIGAEDMRSILSVAAAQNYKVFLVGDRYQHKPVSAGCPFASLQDAGINTLFLNESIRQSNPVLKDVVEKLGQQRYTRALGKLKQNNAVRESDLPEAVLAAEYINLTETERDSTLFICSTHRQRNLVTDLIRNGLKQKEILKNPQEIDILVERRGLSDIQKSKLANLAVGNTVVSYENIGLERPTGRIELINKIPYKIISKDNNSLTFQNPDGSQITLKATELDFNKSIYDTLKIEIASGDRLRWKTSNKSLGIISGQEFKIEAVNGDKIDINDFTGQSQTIPIDLLAYSEYAWTHTSHSAQGRTADNVILLANSNSSRGITSRTSFYTDVARAKERVIIGTSDYKKLLAKISDNLSVEDNPSAYLNKQAQGELNLNNLEKQAQGESNTDNSEKQILPIVGSLEKPTFTHDKVERSSEPHLNRSKSGDGLQPIRNELFNNKPSNSKPAIQKRNVFIPNPDGDRNLTTSMSLYEQRTVNAHIESINREIAQLQADEFLSEKKKRLKIESLNENIQNWEAISQLRKGDRVQNQQGQLGIVEDTTLNHDFVMLYVAWLDEFGNKRFSSPEAPRLLTIAQTEIGWELKQNTIENAAVSPSTSSASRPITRAEKNEQTHKHWDELKAIPLVEVAPILGGVQDKSDGKKWHFGSSATVSIDGDKFKDWKSAAKGSRNAINFVMHINKCDFNSAVTWLEENMSIRATIIKPTITQAASKPTQEKEKVLNMPKVADANWDTAKNYLVEKRQLPPDLIDRLHKEGRIYADDRQNVVFVRRSLKDNDFSGDITGGFRKGTSINKPFAKAVYGTKSDRGWFAFTTGSGQLSKIVITEAAIDAISAATVLDCPDRTMFISSGGASLPIPIDWLVEQNKKGVEINLAFDNDRAGEEWSWRRIKELAQIKRDSRNINRIIPTVGLDWNDQIRNINLQPLNSFDKWEKFAKAIDKPEKYLNRIEEVVAEYDTTQTISDRARVSYLEDYQTYQNLSRMLRQSYESTGAATNSDIIDAAIAFHSPAATPLPDSIIDRGQQFIELHSINSNNNYESITTQRPNNIRHSRNDKRDSPAKPKDDRSAVKSDRRENRENRTNTIAPRPGVIANVGDVQTSREYVEDAWRQAELIESDIKQSGTETEDIKRGFEPNSSSRHKSQRNIEGSGDEIRHSSQQYQRRKRHWAIKRQATRSHFERSSDNLKGDRDTIKGLKNLNDSSVSKQKASLKDYLLTKKHLSPILLDRLLESDLIKLEEGNLTCRHYDLSGEIVGQINPFAADSSKVQGYFNFSQGSGDLTRIVLTSDPIEAMSAATLSTRTNEKNFFVSPQGDVNLSWLNNYAAAGVEIMAAFKDDLVGEQLAWQTTIDLDRPIVRILPTHGSWSNRLNTSVKDSSREKLVDLKDWSTIALSLGKPNEYLQYIETVKKAETQVNQTEITNFNNDYQAFKQTQAKLWQWYSSAIKIGQDSQYLKEIAQIGIDFNRGEPLKPEAIERLDRDLRSYRNRSHAENNLKNTIEATIAPQQQELEKHLHQIAEQASSHIAEVYCQAAAHTFKVELEHLIAEKLGSSAQLTLNSISTHLQDNIDRFVDRLTDDTLTRENTLKQYLESNPNLIERDKFMNTWATDNASLNSKQFVDRYRDLEDILETISTTINKSINLGNIDRTIDWNTYIDSMEVANAARNWLNKYATDIDGNTISCTVGRHTRLSLDEATDRLTISHNDLLVLDVKALNLIDLTTSAKHLKNLNELGKFLRVEYANNQKKTDRLTPQPKKSRGRSH